MAAPNDPAAPLEEVVLLGPHPTLPGVQVLVLGGTGPQVWGMALTMIDLYRERPQAQRLLPLAGLMVVDLQRDVVRAARALQEVT